MRQETLVFIVIAVMCVVFMAILKEAWPMIPMLLSLVMAIKSRKT